MKRTSKIGRRNTNSDRKNEGTTGAPRPASAMLAVGLLAAGLAVVLATSPLAAAGQQINHNKVIAVDDTNGVCPTSSIPIYADNDPWGVYSKGADRNHNGMVCMFPPF